MSDVRVALPFHLRTLARIEGELRVAVEGTVTLAAVLDALEKNHPALTGTMRDHVTRKRRPMVRFFACEQDISDESPEAPLPPAIATGAKPLYVIGAIAGG
ncbi:MAG TPA: MoaD/ThiS family protein [Phycisphaerae bacterium]|nr:MoaD/ThiS family protein [Phycisphaerae bacterium]